MTPLCDEPKGYEDYSYDFFDLDLESEQTVPDPFYVNADTTGTLSCDGEIYRIEFDIFSSLSGEINITNHYKLAFKKKNSISYLSPFLKSELHFERRGFFEHKVRIFGISARVRFYAAALELREISENSGRIKLEFFAQSARGDLFQRRLIELEYRAENETEEQK